MPKKKLTLVMMDAPYENARTVTGLRILDAAVRRGHDVTLFAYEGAVALTFAKQAGHANAVHGRDAIQEEHPLPREWVALILESAKKSGATVDWINCGLCIDERGVAEAIPGARRGTPGDLWKA